MNMGRGCILVSDYDKLMDIAQTYADSHEVFTSGMLCQHILRGEVKFKKNMNTRRISNWLLSSGLFEKAYHKNNKNYYRLCLKDE